MLRECSRIVVPHSRYRASRQSPSAVLTLYPVLSACCQNTISYLYGSRLQTRRRSDDSKIVVLRNCADKKKMRRKAGVGAIHKQKLEQEKYKDKGTEIQETQFEQVTKQMDKFRTNLEEFASKHKNEIRKNAQFRRQFTEMCASIGVDPLASGKGFWSVLGIGEFYYSLAVQIVEVCMATNYKTGGLISLDELRERLIQARGKRKEHQDVTNEDLLAAAKKLRIFGSGFAVVPVGGGRHLVQSVPGELSMDHTAVLQQASLSGEARVSVSLMREKLHWESERARKALEYMVKAGLAWLDEQSEGETLYWFPSLFAACVDSNS